MLNIVAVVQGVHLEAIEWLCQKPRLQHEPNKTSFSIVMYMTFASNCKSGFWYLMTKSWECKSMMDLLLQEMTVSYHRIKSLGNSCFWLEVITTFVFASVYPTLYIRATIHTWRGYYNLFSSDYLCVVPFFIWFTYFVLSFNSLTICQCHDYTVFWFILYQVYIYSVFT